MAPRVLFLDHSGALGGAELALLDIVRHRAASSCVVLLADGPFRARLREAGVAVQVLPAAAVVAGASREGAGIGDLLALPGVARLAGAVARSAAGFDLIYANSQKALLVGALAGRLAGRPVLWHLHDILTAQHFSRARRGLAVVTANLATTRVIANSRASAAALVAAGGRASRVQVVYNGINPGPFDAVSPRAVEALRREMGLAGVPVIGAFSRLAPWKGQHLLLDALTRLPGVHALVVGEALFGERAYVHALRQQAAARGLGERVHFLGFREDIPVLMRLADVVVHTSTAPEPFGRIIIEGMLARRPVVATRAGGVLEIIDDGRTGVLVPPGDARALATALTGLLADPVSARTLAEAGRAAAVRRFSLQAMLDGVERQIREVLAARSTGQRRSRWAMGW